VQSSAVIQEPLDRLDAALRCVDASVDIDPDMTARAEQLLARAGYEVDLRCGDGQHGWAEHAPYDRVIAWCSVDDVPSRGWIRRSLARCWCCHCMPASTTGSRDTAAPRIG
jgi:hypothetical protein